MPVDVVDVGDVRAGSAIVVPAGDPELIRGAARRFRQVAHRGLRTAAVSGSAGPELSQYWQGAVADAARVELGQVSARGLRLLPGIEAGGAALARYADVLDQVIGQTTALRVKAAAARAEHARAVAAAGASATDPAGGVLLRQRADHELADTLAALHRAYRRALDDLMDAASRCARTLTSITAAAGGGPRRSAAAVRESLLANLPIANSEIRDAAVRPVGNVVEREPETWWERATHTAAEAGAWTWNHTAVPLVNGTANVVEAMAEHPEDVLEIALGAAGMVVGGGGEVLGVALDATVVGAPAGVALNLASAGLITVGAATAAHGVGNLANHATQNNNRLLNEASAATPTQSAGTRGQPHEPLPDSLRPDTAGPTWKGRVSNTGKGEVWQSPDSIAPAPGLPKKANSIRLMDPGADVRYPHGYVVFHNRHGQPLRLDGRPGLRKSEDTHIPIRPDGSYDIPAGWSP